MTNEGVHHLELNNISDITDKNGLDFISFVMNYVFFLAKDRIITGILAMFTTFHFC